VGPVGNRYSAQLSAGSGIDGRESTSHGLTFAGSAGFAAGAGMPTISCSRTWEICSREDPISAKIARPA